MQGRLEEVRAQTVQKAVNYFRSHRNRMEYGTAEQKGEPLGSRDDGVPLPSASMQIQAKRTILEPD